MKKQRGDAVLAMVAMVVLITLAVAAWGVPAYFRFQARESAQNTVQINEIVIKQTEQLVQVEKQRADIRVAEANGIAAAQKIINETLTDRYLQHEAIKAQEKMAGSPSHTQIYIPTGNNGIPVVKTVQ